MEKPTLQEWRRENPNKSINEYFRAYPKDTKTENQTDFSKQFNTIQQPIPPRPKKTVKKEPMNVGTILVSIMIFISFFLPWIDIKLLGLFDFISSSGFELPKLLKKMNYDISEAALYSIYLIPICSFLVIILETQKHWLKAICQLITIFTIAYWVYFLNALISSSGEDLEMTLDPMNLFSYGLFILLIGALYYLYEVIKELF